MATTKLGKIGNATGVTLPREALAAAGMSRGDIVAVHAVPGRIELIKVDGRYSRSMVIGRAFARRYRRTMAALAT
jgi:antitoxin component of MazEF toxin-antitoxin module